MTHGKIVYHRDGRISITTAPNSTVAYWRKAESGWEIRAATRTAHPQGVNVSPRSLADKFIRAWAKQMRDERMHDDGTVESLKDWRDHLKHKLVEIKGWGDVADALKADLESVEQKITAMETSA